MDNQLFIEEMINLLNNKISQLSPAESLKLLFELENKIYQIQGRESIRYGNGIHTKHKHIKYHDFFTENIKSGSKVLDIGCGNGSLTYDIGSKVEKSIVFGIDLVQSNIDFALTNFKRENITYVCGDALNDLPDMRFNVIVMSNVLEHIEKRIVFLKQLKSRYKPNKILLRVPIYERDWRVPLKDELNVDYRLDSTHFIEYKQEEFWNELSESGLTTIKHHIKWGEIWAEVK
ncbi:MAG TPA: class I SAM-dependent methyltransferase [Spirochaetota bacterium]|nr:class I SAM-dependent methyltransferase [Spirochaetota bacterium]